MIGKVYKIVFYITLLNKKRKICVLTGLCTRFSKCTRSFTLQNYYGPEFVKFTFPLNAPNILSLIHLTSYNFSFRLSKLYYFKRLKLSSKTDRFNLNLEFSPENPIKNLFPTKPINTKEKKRLRNKFRI